MYEELYKKAAELYDEAEQLITDGASQEDVDAKMAEAKAAEDKAAAAKKIAERKAALKTPQRKPLPTGDPEPQTKATQGPEPEEDGEDLAAKNVYVMRYGEEDELQVKAVLHDIHGSDYRQTRFEQDRAFATYLRGGDRALDYDQIKLLKGVVLTPKQAARR